MAAAIEGTAGWARSRRGRPRWRTKLARPPSRGVPRPRPRARPLAGTFRTPAAPAASAASGSYGHLSAGAASPSLGFAHAATPAAFHHMVSRHRSAFGHTPPLPHHPAARHALTGLPPAPPGACSEAMESKPSGEMAVSSTGDPQAFTKRSKAKSEAGALACARAAQHQQRMQQELEQSGQLEDDCDRDELKQEPEALYETNCRWEECVHEYETQEQLVHVRPRHRAPQTAETAETDR